MHRYSVGVISGIVLACCNPAHAIDFHPLVSQDLAGGVHEYDNIFIPSGVTLTLVGEPRQVTLRALGNLTMEGSLIAPGWKVHLESGNSLHVLGAIDVWGIEPASDRVWRIEPASVRSGSRVTMHGWQDIDVAARGSLSFTASSDVANLDRSGRTWQSGDLRFASEGGWQSDGGSIKISGMGSFAPTPFQSGPALLVIEPGLPVPEPETWAMLLAGLGLLGWLCWKTRA